MFNASSVLCLDTFFFQVSRPFPCTYIPVVRSYGASAVDRCSLYRRRICCRCRAKIITVVSNNSATVGDFYKLLNPTSRARGTPSLAHTTAAHVRCSFINTDNTRCRGPFGRKPEDQKLNTRALCYWYYYRRRRGPKLSKRVVGDDSFRPLA